MITLRLITNRRELEAKHAAMEQSRNRQKKTIIDLFTKLTDLSKQSEKYVSGICSVRIDANILSSTTRPRISIV